MLFLLLSFFYFALFVYRFYYHINIKGLDALLFMSGWFTFSVLADEVPTSDNAILLGLAILVCIVSLAFLVAFILKHFVLKKFVFFLMIAGAGSVIYAAIIVSDWYQAHEVASQERQTKNLVFSFLKEMNPELNRKNTKILAEISRADHNIQQLNDLRRNFPQQSAIIDDKLNQWQTLRLQLNQVSKNIYHKVESAYVTYKMAEIQGKDKLSVISAELLKEANLALANAESTRAILEEQLGE